MVLHATRRRPPRLMTARAVAATLASGALLATAAFGLGPCDGALARDDGTHARAIENAASAAPLAVGATATVLGWPSEPGGDFALLREGSNGWTCLPDRADTPGDDPMCLDEVFFEWLTANLEGREPTIPRVGFAYMLRGGAAADQRSLFVTDPPAGQDWYYVGPHVMVVPPDPAHLDGVSRDTGNGGPFVEALAHSHPIVLFPVAAPDESLDVSRSH